MKVTLNWLKQYVDFDSSPEELSERLTMLGIEVEGVQKLGGDFEGVVVAQVLTRDKHPNADKLSLCRVNDGRGERKIVCGADNFKPGDKGLLILREEAKVGQPFAEYLGRTGSDVVYDLEITPNRPDLNSVLGIAREVA